MKDIIFLPWRDIHNVRKEGFRVREGNVIKGLSEREDINKILLINRARNLKTVLNKTSSGMEVISDIWPNREEVISIQGSKVYKINEKIYSLELPKYFVNKGDNQLETIPFFKHYLFHVIKKAANALQIELASKNTWVWSTDLTREFVFKELKKENAQCVTIFDTIDDLTHHKGYTEAQREANKKKYEVIGENVDVVFSVSEANLKNLFGNYKIKKQCIENGIDIKRFQRKNSQSNNNVKPVCGYVGVIESRIDFQLIKEVIRATPEIAYEFVGPIIIEGDADLEEIKGLSNVTFSGPVSSEEVPNKILSFDICIMPHVLNSFTRSMSPLKFYEYMAAFKPIIMTNVPPADKVGNISGVYIPHSVADWVSSINEALTLQKEQLKNDQERMNLIQSHSWDQVVNKMVIVVEDNGHM